MDTPCRSDKETHSARGQVVRRVLFSPSPCPRGVASETRGCGGLVPRKAFNFGNLSQSQGEPPESRTKPGASPESWAKPGRSIGELGEARRSTGELGEAGRIAGELGEARAKHQSWAKPGEPPELGEARRIA